MKVRHQKERGAAAVEFALLLPLLIAILLGIMEFGWMFFTDLQVTNATRDALRKAVVTLPPEDMDDAAAARLTQIADYPGSGLESGNLSLAVFECDADEESVSIVVRYQYEPLTPLASLPFIPQVILPEQLEAAATMHIDTGEGCGGTGP